MGTIFKNLWHNMNILIIGVTEGEQREKGIKNAVEEMMVENFIHTDERYPEECGTYWVIDYKTENGEVIITDILEAASSMDIFAAKAKISSIR